MISAVVEGFRLRISAITAITTAVSPSTKVARASVTLVVAEVPTKSVPSSSALPASVASSMHGLVQGIRLCVVVVA